MLGWSVRVPLLLGADPGHIREVNSAIVVDAMGGDDAPEAIVAGACEAANVTRARIELVGDVSVLEALVTKYEGDRSRIDLVPAEGVIAMDAKPKVALLEQPQASLPVAARRVASATEPSALVSAGNTGAVVMACAHFFERIPGIRRTALAAVIPTEQRHGEKNDPFSLLLDAGATLRVEAEDLAGFALMGATYASIVSRNQNPKVALLSNGTEPTKGTPEIVAAHDLIGALGDIEFIGNIESLHIPRGTADVIVCDGFTGNITLKMFEGMAEVVMDFARYAYQRRFTWRLGMWFLQSGIRRIKELTDWQQYGGAPILGFDRLCIKAHGRSGPRAIRNAIRVAERCLEQRLCERIAEGVKS